MNLPRKRKDTMYAYIYSVGLNLYKDAPTSKFSICRGGNERSIAVITFINGFNT